MKWFGLIKNFQQKLPQTKKLYIIKNNRIGNAKNKFLNKLSAQFEQFGNRTE